MSGNYYFVDMNRTSAELLLGLINHDNGLSLTFDDVVFAKAPIAIEGERNTKTIVTTKDPAYIDGTDLITVPVMYNRINIAHLFSVAGCAAREIELDSEDGIIALNDRFFDEIKRKYNVTFTAEDFSLSRSADNTYTLHAKPTSLAYIGAVVIRVIWSLTTLVPTRVLDGFERPPTDARQYGPYFHVINMTRTPTTIVQNSPTEAELVGYVTTMTTPTPAEGYNVSTLLAPVEDGTVGYVSADVVQPTDGIKFEFNRPKHIFGVAISPMEFNGLTTKGIIVRVRDGLGGIMDEQTVDLNQTVVATVFLRGLNSHSLEIVPREASHLVIKNIALLEDQGGSKEVEYVGASAQLAWAIPQNLPIAVDGRSNLVFADGTTVTAPNAYEGEHVYRLSKMFNRTHIDVTDGYMSQEQTTVDFIEITFPETIEIIGFIYEALREDGFGNGNVRVDYLDASGAVVSSRDEEYSADVSTMTTHMPTYVKSVRIYNQYTSHLAVGRFDIIKKIK